MLRVGEVVFVVRLAFFHIEGVRLRTSRRNGGHIQE